MPGSALKQNTPLLLPFPKSEFQIAFPGVLFIPDLVDVDWVMADPTTDLSVRPTQRPPPARRGLINNLSVRG